MSEIKDRIVQELRRIAHELGRPPKRDELSQHTTLITRHDIEKHFGIYTEALKAAGLDKKSERQETKARVDKFFQRGANDIVQAVEAIRRKYPRQSEIPGYVPTVFIPDLHCPWWSEAGICELYLWLERLKPKRVITLGDSYDMFAFSSFPKSGLKYTPDEELNVARSQLESMWKTIHKILPNAECHAILGNHSIRPMKSLIQSGMGHLERFMDFKTLFEFDGVITHHDSRSPLVLENVSVIHGYLSGMGKHRTVFNTHIVHGHTHSLNLTQHNVAGKLLWEMSCGYLGDPAAKCFNYTAMKETGWRRGIGYLSELGPILIPFD